MTPALFIGFIYVVTNTKNGKVYVGKTIKPFDGRWQEHLRDARAKRGHYLHNAIRKHGVDAFQFEIVDMAFGEDDLNSKEREYIFREVAVEPKFGYNLNSGGGKGCVVSESTKKKQAESVKEVMARPEVKQRQSDGVKAAWERSGYRQRHAAAMADPEYKRRSSQTRKDLWTGAEYRQRQAEYRTPDFKQRQSELTTARMADPEARQKNADVSKALWADPAYRAKILEAQRAASTSTALRQLRSASRKALWKDPAYRNMMLETLKRGRATRQLRRSAQPAA